jgi:hypothetical protein
MVDEHSCGEPPSPETTPPAEVGLAPAQHPDEQPGGQPLAGELRPPMPGSEGEGHPGEEALAAFLSGSDPIAEQADLSRRQFLTGTLAGGAAGLAVAAGTGVGVWKIMDANRQAELQAAQREIDRLRGLVKLYEELDKTGLDAILQAGMAALALPLEGVQRGALLLKSGLDLVEGSLLSFSESLPSAQAAMLWLEDRVSDLAGAIGRLEQSIGRALERAGENPVVQALEDLVNLVLDKLPLGLGSRFRGALEAVVEVMTTVDDTLTGINSSVLEPLREKWFSTQEGKGVGAALIDPLVRYLLDPLEAHLANLASLADAWQAKLVVPARAALEQRAKVRESITQYKAEHSAQAGALGLGPSTE